MYLQSPSASVSHTYDDMRKSSDLSSYGKIELLPKSHHTYATPCLVSANEDDMGQLLADIWKASHRNILTLAIEHQALVLAQTS